MANEQNEDIFLNIAPSVAIQMGDSLYSNFAAGICEFISNSYDADSENVYITFSIINNLTNIEICDDGNGMNLDELKNYFFSAGSNRRVRNNTNLSFNKKRLVTGKKGIGKLAMLGLAEETIVDTSKDGYRNKFKINTNDVLQTPEKYQYRPECIIKNMETNDKNGTKIILRGVNKKIPINLPEQLYRRISYLQEDFKITLIFKEDEAIYLTREGRRKFLEEDAFRIWNIPEDFLTIGIYSKEKKVQEVDEMFAYFSKNKINGYLIAKNKTIRARVDRGIALFANGKLCCESNFFKIQDANDYSFAYLYGELNVDFIDGDMKNDNIGTNRKELKENAITEELEKHIKTLLNMYREFFSLEKKTNLLAKADKNNFILNMEEISNKIETIKDKTIQDNFYSLYKNIEKRKDSSMAFNFKQIIDILNEHRYLANIDLPDNIIQVSNDVQKDYDRCKKLLFQGNYDSAIAHAFKLLNSYLEIHCPNMNEKDKENRIRLKIKEIYKDYDDRVKGNLSSMIASLKAIRDVTEHRDKKNSKLFFRGDFQSAELCINSCFVYILFIHKIMI